MRVRQSAHLVMTVTTTVGSTARARLRSWQHLPGRQTAPVHMRACIAGRLTLKSVCAGAFKRVRGMQRMHSCFMACETTSLACPRPVDPLVLARCVVSVIARCQTAASTSWKLSCFAVTDAQTPVARSPVPKFPLQNFLAPFEQPTAARRPSRPRQVNLLSV